MIEDKTPVEIVAPRGKVYWCVIATAKKLQLDKNYVLKSLESRFIGITKLVTNYEACLKHPSRHLNKLSGPSELTFFNSIMGKRMLFLGEYHSHKYICGSDVLKTSGAFEIQEWLIKIAENSPSCIDIFTESDYKSQFPSYHSRDKLKPHEGLLIASNEMFTRLKLNNHLPDYLRHHDIDARIFKGSRFPLMEFGFLREKDKSWNFDKSYEVDMIHFRHKKYEKEILSYMIGIDRSEKTKEIYHGYLKQLYSLLPKEQNFNPERFSSLENEYFKTIDKEMSKMNKNIDKAKFLDIFLSVNIEAPADVTLEDKIFIAPMDLYFLVRLFIEFDKTKLKRGPKGCRFPQNESMNNVIVYAGAAHADIYRAFIEKYFGVVPNINIKEDYKIQCLSLDNFDYFEGK